MALQDSTKKLIEERNTVIDPTTPGDIPQISSADLMKGMGFAYDPTTSTVQPSVLTVPIGDVPRSASRRLGVGYDPYFGDLNERLAQDQTVAERLAYMIPRIGTKVLSEVAQIPGYLGGLGMWAATGFDPSEIGQMVDNGWIQAVQGAEQEVKEAMPVFTPKSVQDGGLMANIFSSSFWANEGADGIGFLLSMLVPGQALKALKVGKGIANLPKLVKPGFSATLGAISKADMMAAATINTLYEAGAEAGESYRDMMSQTGDKQKAGEAAANTMKANFLILLGPNLLQQRWLFGGFNRAAAASTNVSKAAQKAGLGRLINKETGELLTDVAARPKYFKANKIVTNALKGIGMEGFFEEGMQYASAEYAKEKAADGEQENIFNSVLGTLETYLDNITETEMQKNIFLGAVLGGGMTTISSVRDLQQEEQMLKGTTAKTRKGIAKFIGMQDRKESAGLHSLLQNNYLNRYRTFMDLVERDEAGNPVEEDGRYKLDPLKVKEAGSHAMREVQRKAERAAAAHLGEREMYEYLKQQDDFDYMLPFLQQPGGYELLKQHINHMAEKDAAAFKEETGIDPGDINDIKADLLTKAETYNKIVNKIEQRHSPNFNIKHDKADQAIFDQYSNTVKYSKFSEAASQDHYIRRMNLIKKELSEYDKGGQKVPITSTDDTIEGYKESLKEQKDKLSAGDIDTINKAIEDFEVHEKSLKESKIREKDLYNKTILQKGYFELIQKKQQADKDLEDSKSNVKKNESLAGLDPKLQGLYDIHTQHETVKVGAEEFDAVHSSELEVSYKDKEGNIQKATVSIVPGRADTQQGNLIVKDTDGRTAFINADNTFGYTRDEQYEIEKIDVKKSVDDVIKDRHLQSRVDALKEAIDFYQNSVLRLQGRITKGIDYIQELYERQEKLQQKELESLKKYGTKLTRKGSTRVESIKVLRGRGSRITQMYLNADQIQQEIEYTRNTILRLEEARDNRVVRMEQLQEENEQVLVSTSDERMGNILNTTIDLIKEQIDQTNATIDASSSALNIADNYLKKLRTLMRGYNTTAARLLGISDRIAFIRNNPEMGDSEKALTEASAIAAALHASDGLTDEFNEIDGVLDNIIALRNKIRETEDTIAALASEAFNADFQKDRLKLAYSQRNKVKEKFQEVYKNYLESMGLLSTNIDQEAAKSGTLEDTYENLNSSERKIVEGFEEGVKHPFVDEKSWLYTTSNQDVLLNPQKYGDTYTDSDINDMIRWQRFVGDYAYWTFTSNKSKFKGKKKFLLKSFSYSTVADFKESHPLRTKLKFWAGKEYGFKSYEELQKLPEIAVETAKEDIKVVAYERKEIDGKMTVNLLSADAQGDITAKNATDIFFTSLLSGDIKTARNYDRFSLKNIYEAKLKELLKESKLQGKLEDAPEKLKKQANNFAQATLEKSAEGFAKVREELKSTSRFFNIDSIAPGAKNYKNADKQEVMQAIGKEDKDIQFLSFKIYDKDDATVKLSGTKFSPRAGYGYVKYRSRLEIVTPKTLDSTNSVDDIVNLFRYLANDPENKTQIETYIKIILNMTNTVEESKLKYRMAFVRPSGLKGLRSGEFTKILFGDQGEVTKEQLTNNEGLAEFKEFLKDKYWNFSFKALKAENFTEFKVDNSLKQTETVWETKDGGYKGFLFSSKGTPKGTIYITPRASTEVGSTKAPQYMNQAIRLVHAPTQQEIEGRLQAQPTNIVHAKILMGATNAPVTPQAGGVLASLNKPTTTTTETPPPPSEPPPASGGILASLNKQNTQVENTPTEDTWKPTNPAEVIHGASEAQNNTSDQVLKQDDPAPPTNRFVDAEAYWAWLKENNPTKYDYYLKDASESAAKTRAFRAYQKQGNDNNIYRLVNDISRYKAMDISAARQWLEQKFPGLPVEMVAGLIDGRAWGQFYKGSKVLLSSLAAVGTEYHEAFHVVSKIFLSSEESNSLYVETRKVLNKPKATDAEIEEILAEEFREYMMADGNYKFGSTVDIRKSTFQKILDYLLQIINGMFGTSFNKPSQALTLFEDINTKEFNLVDRKSWSEETLNRIGELSERESTAYVKDMNFRFFQKLFGPTEIISEDGIFRLQKDKQFQSQLYDALKQDYKDELAEDLMAEGRIPEVEDVPVDFNSAAASLLRNWKSAVKSHRDYVFQYDLDIREFIEDDERISDSPSFFESNVVSMNTVTPHAIRLTIAGLPSVTRNGEGTTDLTWSDFDTNSTAAYNKIMNILKNSLSNIDTFWGMVDELQRLRLSGYPEIDHLLNRLGVPLDNNDIKDVSDSQLTLLVQLYKAFSNNKNIPKIFVFENDGRKSVINAVDIQDTKVLKNSWMNTAKAEAGQPNSLIKKTKDGKYIVDKPSYIQNAINMIKATSEQEQMNIAYAILKATGLNLDKYIYNIDNLSILYDYVNETAKQLKAEKEDVTLQDLFNPKVIESQGETKALLEYVATVIPNDADLMFINQEGRSEYSVTLNSHISNTVTKLNEVAETGETNSSSQYLFDNLFGAKSLWLKRIREGRKLQMTLLRGAKNNTSGVDTSKLTYTDYKAMLFNSILDNTIPMLRAADRKLEYAFKMDATNYGITDGRFLSDSYNYLKDELATSFALLVNKVGSNLANYSTNAQGLRSFDYLFDEAFTKGFKGTLTSLNDFISDNVEPDIKLSNEELEELSDNYISENKALLDKIISKYNKQNIDLNIESLTESGVIIPKKDDSGNVIGYIIPGLDTSLVADAGINIVRGEITAQEMRQLARVASYNSWVGNQEQLKIFFGDLAMYSNVDNFHKRTTGAASTRQKLINDQWYIDQINERYKRFDRRPHSKTMRKIVYADITKSINKVDQDLIKNVSSKYAKANGVDAQVWATLDEYRGIMLRDGSWFEGNEKTYQYEMQKLAIKVLNNPELLKVFPLDEGIFIAEGGIFYDHTNGQIPSSPMYAGKVISQEEMTPLPPLKPQSFGHIANVSDLNATQFYKLSMAPIFPSLLNDDMLKHHLSMLQEGVGAFGFVTADKVTHLLHEGQTNQLLDSEGKPQLVNEATTAIQEMSYDEFGIQLNIAEDPKGSVTRSTQRERLEFLDMFKLGDMVIESDLYDEYYNLIKEIAQNDFQTLISDSGLTKTSEGVYELTEENAERFGNLLEKAFWNRAMPYNAIDGIKEVIKTKLKVFDILVNKNKIEEVLLSMVRNKLIHRETNGELLIQESSYLYFGDDLNFYRRNENETVAMQVAVPLPKEWTRLVEEKGGLDLLNGLIKERNWSRLRSIYGDIDKALNISGVRIPVQGLNSMEAMNIVQFLPAYMGSKILMPHEVTVKAGSDFDIDKMTTYLKNMKIEGGKLIYKDNNEDKLNDIAFTTLLDPRRFNDLLTPNDDKYIKKLANDIIVKRKQTNLEQANSTQNWSKATQMWYNFQRAAEFWGGKAVIGLAAIHNKSNATHQQTPVAIKSKLVKLFFEGQTISKEDSPFVEYVSGHLEDSDGRKISQNLSEFMTSFLDVAKDPRVFYLNTGTDAFGIWAFLNRFGRNEGVGAETLAHFMTQDIILDYLAIQKKSKSLSWRTSKEINPGFDDDRVSALLNKLGSISIQGVPDTYEQTLAASYKAYFEAPEGTTERTKAEAELERKLNEYDYVPLSKATLKGKLSNKEQIQVLDNFLMYEFFANQLSKLNTISNGDSNLEPSISAMESKIAIQEELMDNGFFDPEDIQALMKSNPLLSTFNTVRDDTRKMYSWAFITKKYPEVNSFFYERFVKPFTKKIWGANKRAVALRTIESDFITFLIETTGRSYDEVHNDYEDTLFSETSTAKQLLAIKPLINNELLNEIEPVIAEYNRSTKRTSPQDYVTTFDKKADLYAQNSFTSAWIDLLEHPDKGVQAFARKLIRGALYQSGVNNSPIAYLKYAPNAAYSEVASKALEEFSNYPVKLQQELMKTFEEQMYRNNWNNSDIVPSRRKVTSWTKYKSSWAPYSDREKSEDNQYYTRTYVKDNQFFTVLFKKGLNTRTGKIMFTAIPKMGNSFKFKEYYPVMADDISRSEFRSMYNPNHDHLGRLNIMDDKTPQFKAGPISEYDRITEDRPEAVEQALASMVDKQMFGIEEVDRMKEVLSELNREDIPDSVRESLAQELENLYFQAPGERVTFDQKRTIRETKELRDKVEEFFKAVGFELQSVEKIYDKFGKEVPKAVAMANIAQRTVQAVDGRLAIHHLPEEAAHVYVALLPDTHPLKKSMMNKITNYDIYNTVKTKYADLYTTEEQFKEEAVGQLIAQHMVQLNRTDVVHTPALSENQQGQVSNWWKALWTYVRKAFGLQDVFKRSAYNIMNLELEGLTRKAEELGTDTSLYALDSMNWNSLFADRQIGNVKYRYFRSTSQAEEFLKQAGSAFGTQNVSMSPKQGKELAKVIIQNPERNVNKIEEVSKEITAENNFKEFDKEDAGVGSKNEIITNFEKYYPALDYMNVSERTAFVDALSIGELEQMCGI